jgi:hypothetical protein
MRPFFKALRGVGWGLVSLGAGAASAECFTITRGPTYDVRWTASDSLSTDTRAFREYYPSQCSGLFLCDVVSYRVQAFTGEWSPEYFPGVNDHTQGSGGARRVWRDFYDHVHSYTFCN